jgi:phospholipid-translocating ATPase
VSKNPHTALAQKTRHFLLCMALCNTCLPEEKDGGIAYQASSPDELALVEAARDLGYVMVDRTPEFVVLKWGEHVERFEVLDVIEFTSKRKRMSIILRMPDGRICVFCKGADSAIVPRLKMKDLAAQKQREVERVASQRRSRDQDVAIRRRSMALERSNTVRSDQSWRLSDEMTNMDRPRISMSGDFAQDGTPYYPSPTQQHYVPEHEFRRHQSSRPPPAGAPVEGEEFDEPTIFEKCFEQTNEFAAEGLRTLLFASRDLEEHEYTEWQKIYRAATTSIENRRERIEEAGELIESAFDLVGSTGIEDKLQDGVPETIDKLRLANIKVWMLTGDKRETAINIGHSAHVCKPISDIYHLDSQTDPNLLATLQETYKAVARGDRPHTVVVVDGGTLAVMDEDDKMSDYFYELVVRADSVICCRASPAQKAHLVKEIRNNVPGSLTLAIGDGANDISMILASHVGIGISGREGLQAARSADFSIAQFRFLQRLLFVHGRWNYMRTGKYILATFWKEIFFFTVQAHYQRFNGYSGTSLFENWSLTVFNGVFTSIPVWILGILDKDLEPATLLRFPELYSFGQEERGFNFKMYLGWSVIGAVEAAIMFYGVWAVYRELAFDQDTSLYAMGSVGFTVGVIFINFKLL